MRQSEIIKEQLSSQNDGGKSLEEVRKRFPGRNRRFYANIKVDSHPRQKVKKLESCQRCGLQHGPSCPAKNVKCHKCSKLGHYARCCKTKIVTEVQKKTVMDESESSEEEFFIASVADSSSSKGWYVELPVNGHNVKFKTLVLMFQLFLWKPTTTYLMFHACDQLNINSWGLMEH